MIVEDQELNRNVLRCILKDKRGFGATAIKTQQRKTIGKENGKFQRTDIELKDVIMKMYRNLSTKFIGTFCSVACTTM